MTIRSIPSPEWRDAAGRPFFQVAGAGCTARAPAAVYATTMDQVAAQNRSHQEGGMVTGRSESAELSRQRVRYVNGYDDGPTNDQAARTDALAHELEDVLGAFSKLAAKELPA